MGPLDNLLYKLPSAGHAPHPSTKHSTKYMKISPHGAGIIKGHPILGGNETLQMYGKFEGFPGFQLIEASQPCFLLDHVFTLKQIWGVGLRADGAAWTNSPS